MAWRTRRHFLESRAPRKSMLAVAGFLGGLHAQLMASAELALWARVEGLEPKDVADALWKRRTLVKTWAMRGTLHLLPAADYPLWQAGFSQYTHYLKQGWFRYFGYTRESLEQTITAIDEALRGRQLTREALADRVESLIGEAKAGDPLRQSWGSTLKPAAFRGALCFAESTGPRVQFTHPAAWLRSGRPVAPERAMPEIARRFLAAYGPATRQDFAWWWGTPPPAAGRLLEALGAAVAPVDVEGAKGWALRTDLADLESAEPARTARLLPAFDQYVVAASRHAAHLLPGPFKARVYRNQGWLSPVILVDGRIDGVWSHARKGRRLVVRLEPFVKLPGWARGGLEAEAERLAEFLGGTLELVRAGEAR